MKNKEKYYNNKSFPWHVIKVSRIISRMYNALFQSHGISPSQSGILCILSEAEKCDDEINQVNLSQALFINAVNTHKLISALKTKEFVTTTECKVDKRCSVIELTNKGRELIPAIQEADRRIKAQLEAICITTDEHTDNYEKAHKFLNHIIKLHI